MTLDNGKDFTNSEIQPIKLYDVLTASSAAPTYFSPH